MDDDRLLSLAELASRLGSTKRQADYLVRSRGIRPAETRTGRRYWRASDLPLIRGAWQELSVHPRSRKRARLTDPHRKRVLAALEGWLGALVADAEHARGSEVDDR